MSRDYAKKAKPRKRTAAKKTHHSKSSGRFKFYVIALLLIGFGFFRYAIFDVNQIHNDVVNSINYAQKKSKKATAPVFEFYTRLPKGQSQESQLDKQPMSSKALSVLAKSAPLNQAQNSAQEATQQVLDSSHQFLIQVGSFKRFSDADKLRAALILQGFQVRLSKFVNNTVTWHRVEVGPFQSLKQAKTHQSMLEKQHLNGLIKQLG